MIYVHKLADSTPPPLLLHPESKGSKEKARALRIFRDGIEEKGNFEFEAYSSPGVKKTLEALFNDKCAYCESKYAHVADGHIEHYRPKNGYFDESGNLTTPGYYWLAADWSNLLPSCPHCNAIRWQDTEDGYMKTGKGNHFPLEDETKRAKKPGEEILERPLLLNPSYHKPEQHLEFLDNGTVRPAIFLGKESTMGDKSIKIYGLRRDRLVRLRRMKALQIKNQIDVVEDIISNIKRYPDDPNFKRNLEIQLEILKRFMRPEEEYAALARSLIRQFLSSHNIQNKSSVTTGKVK